jgi:hypothetical protein
VYRRSNGITRQMHEYMPNRNVPIFQREYMRAVPSRLQYMFRKRDQRMQLMWGPTAGAIKRPLFVSLAAARNTTTARLAGNCDPSCSSCAGPGPGDCLACSNGKTLGRGSCVSSPCQASNTVIPGLGACIPQLVNTTKPNDKLTWWPILFFIGRVSTMAKMTSGICGYP